MATFALCITVFRNFFKNNKNIFTVNFKNQIFMKKSILFFSFILFFTGSLNVNSQTFITTYSKTDNKSRVPENYMFRYDPSDSSIKYSNSSGTYAYGPVELSERRYEQGLYFEIYTPTVEKLLKSNLKKIYKLGYDSKGGKPVLVAEISYTSNSNYQIKLYYTEYYFELL